MNTETDIEYLKHERPVTAYYKKVRLQSLPLVIKWLDYMIWDDFPDKFCNGKDGKRNSDSKLESKVGTEQLMLHFRGTFNNGMVTTNEIMFGKDLRKYVQDKGLPFEGKGVRMTGGKSGWVFTRRKVLDWLIENDYTEHFLNEEGEEYGGLPMPIVDQFVY